MTIINDLEILEEFKQKHAWYYRFKCVCGKEGVALRKHIQTQHTKSCGCRRAKVHQPKSTPLLPVTSAENKLFNQYVRDANKRGIDFLLTKKQFLLFTKQNCHLCGSAPSNTITFDNSTINWNGLDRLDSKGVYAENNVKSCCTKCNRAKHYLSEEDFLEVVQKVYAHKILGQH